MKASCIIHIREGIVQNPAAMYKCYAQLTDGRYRVDFKNMTKRTIPQNNWLHAILPDIVEGLRNAGYSEVRHPEDAKAVIKALFFSKEISNGVETIKVIEGTSEQTKLDFASKADDIIRWGAEYLGIDIAPPEKQLEVKYAD